MCWVYHSGPLMWDAPHLLAKIIFFDAAKCNKPAAANNSSLQLERAPVPPREAWIVFFSTAFNSTILAQRCKDRRRRTTLPALAAIRNLEHYSSKEQPALKPQLRANGLFEELVMPSTFQSYCLKPTKPDQNPPPSSAGYSSTGNFQGDFPG